jgi:SNF2 family DNA or RNA helicase
MRDKYIIWCDLNDEQNQIAAALGDNCVSIQGSTPNDKKIELLNKWREEDIPVLVTKSKIFGYGLNFQNCHNMIFFGLNDSYEQYYQALRRCWRFGQTHEVNVYIIISAKEGCVKENIERKQADFLKMQTEMTELTKDITKKELKSTCRISTPYEPHTTMKLPDWEEFTA